MKILPKKYLNYVFPFFVAFMMSIIMSGYITFINLGFNDLYFSNWFKAWYSAFLLALPISYLVIPTVKKGLEKISY